MYGERIAARKHRHSRRIVLKMQLLKTRGNGFKLDVHDGMLPSKKNRAK